MSEEQLQVIRDTIKETVNGKIDRLQKAVEEQGEAMKNHNIKHEADMADLRPIIKQYKDRVILDKFLQKAGDNVKWVSSVLAAILVLWLFIKGLFTIK